MSDIHPEELLDRAATGAVSEAERAWLDRHLAECPSCSAQLLLPADFALEDESQVDDEARVDSIVNGALARLEVTESRVEALPPARSARGAFASRRLASVVAWAAMVLLVTGGGIATALWFSQGRSAPEPGESRKRATHPPPPRAPEPPAESTPSEEPAVPGPDPSEAATPTASEPASDGRRATPRATPSTLMDAANRARRAGQHPRAHRLYGILQRRFPGSREARVSRIADGRLLLDHLGNPAGALAQFNRYLAQSEDRTLAEEARVGRALASRRLGRTTDERRAWEDLIEHHPSSMYVARARRRLEELRSAPGHEPL